MRVVVVGGTGNISTGVVKALLGAGHNVTVYTRGQTPSRLPSGVRYLQGDRQDRAGFEELMQAERFDAGIDMICFTAEDAESSVRAFRNVQHLLFTSTTATLGGPLADVPATETTPPRPVSDYGRNKLAAEKVFLAAHTQGTVPVTIFKACHIWGPGMIIIRQLSSDPHWLDRIQRGLPLLTACGGETLWSYCHSDDAGAAYAAALGRSRCLGETYILTGPYTTWREYHERVADALGHKIHLVDAPADFLIKVWPDNTGLLASLTRWHHCHHIDKILRDIPEFQPRITLEEGIPANVAWMEEQGLLADASGDDTEERILASIDRLYNEWDVGR